MIVTRELRSLADTESLASEIAQKLRGGETLGLNGELGAGKTTFVMFLAKKLGASDQVTSPSFVLQHIYQGSIFVLEHWDLYRLSALPEELEENIEEKTVRVVEWAEKCKLRCDLTINIRIATSGFRVVEIVV